MQNTFTHSPAAPRRRSPLKIIVSVLFGLPAAFLGLCTILAFVNPPDPAAIARAEAKEKRDSAVQRTFVAQFAGVWTGHDGTTIIVRGDGGADFDMGSVSVKGGSAHFSPQASAATGTDTRNAGGALEIRGLFGVGRTWTIDAMPHSADYGHLEMTLNGVVYQRAGAS